MKGLFVAVIHPRANGNGYECRVPDMPGCITSGKTLEEAIPNDQDPALSSRFAEIASGESCLVCEAFELPKRENVSIQTHDQDGNVLSQVLRIPQ